MGSNTTLEGSDQFGFYQHYELELELQPPIKALQGNSLGKIAILTW